MIPNSFKRPQRGESQEDLERQEQEFLRQIGKQKVKQGIVTDPGSVGDGETENEKRGLAAPAERPSVEEILRKFHVNPLEDDDNSFQEDPLVQSLQIKERSMGQILGPAESDLAYENSGQKPPQPKKKVSLFAKSKLKNEGTTSQAKSILSAPERILNLIPNVETKNETIIGDKIHPFLAGMTESEILEEQRKLIAKMDPKLVEFVRSRKKIGNQPLKDTCQAQSADMTSTSAARDQIKTQAAREKYKDLPINPKEVKSIPHMDKVERDKLAWTLPVEPAVSEQSDKTTADQPESQSNKEGRNARFDFKGNMVYDDQDTKTWLQGLHHHGEEMDRPGYTLEELLTLARSTNIGQRTTAFNTLAAILRNAHEGVFDMVLDKSILNMCQEMDFIYVVRKGIDNTDVLTTNASINCLSALLYCEREEMSLDIVCTWRNSDNGPWIKIDYQDERDDLEKRQSEPSSAFQEETLQDNDQQINSKDLIEFLITRSALLDRFKYLLQSTTDSLSASGLINMLQILIRIARHSPELLLQQEPLLDYFLQHHLRLLKWVSDDTQQPKQLEGIPLPLVLKLMRLIVTSSKGNAHKVISKYGNMIFSSIEEILAFEGQSALNIPHIEHLIQQSFLVWASLVDKSCAGVDEYLSFSPIVINFFNLYLRNDFVNLFDLNHAAFVVFLTNEVLKVPNVTFSDHFQQCSRLLGPLVVKLCTVLSSNHLVDQVNLLYDGFLSLLQQSIEFFIIASTKSGYVHTLQIEEPIEKFLSTNIFQKISQNLTKLSPLLHPLPEDSKFKDKYPPNMMLTEAVLFGGMLNPILKQGTGFALMTTLAAYLKTCRICKPEKFLNQHIQNYLHNLSSSRKLCTQDNYYLKFELYCVYEILEFIQEVEGYANLCAQVTYRLCSLVQFGNEDLCQKFIRISITPFKQALPSEDLADLTKLYCKLIEPVETTIATLNFKYWKPKLLTSEWVTQPLNAIYLSLQKNNQVKIEEVNQPTKEGMTAEGFRQTVLMILKFIHLCLTTNSIQVIQNKSEFLVFYVRVCQCFMMSPEIFLYKPIREILSRIFHVFSSHCLLKSKSPVFTQVVTGSKDTVLMDTPFETFYSQLMTEFDGCSYGDEVFTAYVLLFRNHFLLKP